MLLAYPNAGVADNRLKQKTNDDCITDHVGNEKEISIEKIDTYKY